MIDDDLFILSDVNLLNIFLEKFTGDEPFIPIENPIVEQNIITISEEELKSEDKLDKAINLFNYTGYVECNFNPEFHRWMLKFKENGVVKFEEGHFSPFSAKRRVVEYLSELGLVNIIKINNVNNGLVNQDKINDDSNYKVCPICLKKFSPNSVQQKYCHKCRIKYPQYEREILVGINNGSYNQSTINEIKKLFDKGYSRSKIAKMFKFSSVSSINFLLKYDNKIQSKDNLVMENNSEHTKICPICGNSFTFKKSVHTQKYCDDCKLKYNYVERMVLTKINEGEISRSTADKIRDLQVQKYSDMVIAKKLGLRTNFIPIILDYFSEIDNTTVEKEDTNVSSPSKNPTISRIMFCPSEISFSTAYSNSPTPFSFIILPK